MSARRRRRRKEVKERERKKKLAKYDPDRAQNCRTKRADRRTKEEQAWCRVDRVLNPAAWAVGAYRKGWGKGEDEGSSSSSSSSAGMATTSNIDDISINTSGSSSKNKFVAPFPLDPELAKEMADEKKKVAQAELAKIKAGEARRAELLLKAREKRRKAMKAKRVAAAASRNKGLSANASAATATAGKGEHSDNDDDNDHAVQTAAAVKAAEELLAVKRDRKVPGPNEEWEIGDALPSRKELMEVWAAPPHDVHHMPRPQRLLRLLLDNFNGKFEEYRDWAEEKQRKQRLEFEAKERDRKAKLRARGIDDSTGLRGGILGSGGEAADKKSTLLLQVSMAKRIKKRQAHIAMLARTSQGHPDPDDGTVQLAMGGEGTIGLGGKSGDWGEGDGDDEDDDELDEEDDEAELFGEMDEEGGAAVKGEGGGGGKGKAGVGRVGAFHGGEVSELKEANYDVDHKCRVVLEELDKANNNPHQFMDCALLMGQKQRYATETLREKLSFELDKLFREQMLERERAGRFVPLEQEDPKAVRHREKVKAAAKNGSGVGNESSDSDSEIDEDDHEGGGGWDDGEDLFLPPTFEGEDASAAVENPFAKKRTRARETVRRWEFKEKLERTHRIRNARNAIGEEAAGNGSGGGGGVGGGSSTSGVGASDGVDESSEDAARAKRASQRPDYCTACDSSEGCIWQPCCDVGAVTERRKVLASELHYTRLNGDAKSVESYVPLSSMRGGSTKHRREDLVSELKKEDTLMAAYLRLNLVDKELHDTHATPKEYVTVASVHGYESLMWVGDAKQCLTKLRNELLGQTLVSELVDDMLDSMLEGWCFGEKESSFTIAGFVPSVKADGTVRSGSDQRRAMTVAEENRVKKELGRKPGEVFEHERDGTPGSKNESIEVSAQQRLFRAQATKVVQDKDHHLAETENTLKFGAFMLALHYFKALTVVRREKASWLGQDDRMEGPNVRPITDERRRMVGEQKQYEYRRMELTRVMKRASRGEEARLKREKDKREQHVKRYLADIKSQKLARKGAVHLQRLYRGHLGRKAAMRWAVKKAELEAMLALMHASATTLQRAFRGFVGRMDAAERRAEMAEFIAMLRMEESAAEEEDYWKENTFERLQRDWSIFWQTSKAVLSNSEALHFNTKKHLLPVQEFT
jgi:hypothetical protein